MGGRAHPEFCEECDQVVDWGDFGPEDWDGESQCICLPEFTSEQRTQLRQAVHLAGVEDEAWELMPNGTAVFTYYLAAEGRTVLMTCRGWEQAGVGR